MHVRLDMAAMQVSKSAAAAAAAAATMVLRALVRAHGS